ncbi:Nucleotide-diphospho-sugar transferase [Glarea lozoyensis ATCC 20868]|uniref:Nucleotide-diphospho-sugar transferase n=1 Tax=Glarea lozoyensis (strain ATCC 20868 / MF5171) TaxID=1116229 RepID=S3EEG6_GLAL2|nr:Nucleotide-diphospho-sugar transferase [Glarea lozoyensis ATCC 20868]EPE36643.1 Nucleotide-diphospho-sugar transferase [Glarea lozoyensis ATCC 20868]
MLAKYSATWNRIPWGVVLIFFSFVVFLHLVLHEFSPWERDLVKAQLISGNGSVLPAETTTDYEGLGNVGAATDGDGDAPITDEPEADAHDDPTGMGNPAMYPEDSSEEYVAICMAVKDQVPDLSEVLLHHYHHLGIRRFYLMDDGSEPPLSTYEDWSIPREHITFHYYNRTTDHVPNMQDTVYNECINLYRKKHTWMAFLDADEMLEVTAEETLKELLQRLEKNRSIGALAVSWMTHTSNGLLERPSSARKGFTDCIWDGNPTHNGMYKSIVKTEMHDGASGVHGARLLGNTKTVGEDGFEVSGGRRTPTRDRIALHHYAVKSRQEYIEKMQRSNAMDQPKPWSFWDEVEAQGGVPCPQMAMYEP